MAMDFPPGMYASFEDESTGEVVVVPMGFLTARFPSEEEEKNPPSAAGASDPDIPMFADQLLPNLWSTLDNGSLSAQEKALKRAVICQFAGEDNPRRYGLSDPRKEDGGTSAYMARLTVEALKRRKATRLVYCQERNVKYMRTLFKEDKQLLASLIELVFELKKRSSTGSIQEEIQKTQTRIMRNALIAAQLKSEVRDINAILKERGLVSAYDDECKEVASGTAHEKK